jgi:pyruvate, water dikinase
MLEVVEKAIADKHVEIVVEGAQTVEREIEGLRRTEPSIDYKTAREIAVLAKRAEQHHGRPQDLEWAVEDGEVLLLQCRPETVWANKAPAKPAVQGGLLGIVDTLINPLASRRSTHVSAGD